MLSITEKEAPCRPILQPGIRTPGPRLQLPFARALIDGADTSRPRCPQGPCRRTITTIRPSSPNDNHRGQRRTPIAASPATVTASSARTWPTPPGPRPPVLLSGGEVGRPTHGDASDDSEWRWQIDGYRRRNKVDIRLVTPLRSSALAVYEAGATAPLPPGCLRRSARRRRRRLRGPGRSPNRPT